MYYASYPSLLLNINETGMFPLGILLSLFHRKNRNFPTSNVYTVQISFSFIPIRYKVQYVI